MAEVTAAEDVLKKISAKHLECSICFARYNHPKILDCLHSFCVQCLDNYRTAQYPSSVKLPCPLCRRDTPMPGEGVLGLKGNFNLTALVEEFTNQESLLRRQQSQIVCEVCEDEGAISRCIECKDYLCCDCQKAHKRAVKTKKHQIATLEDLRSGKASFKSKMRDEIPKCKNHTTQDVVFFCKTCQVLICPVCTALDHSSNTSHVYVYIDEAEKFFREEAKILLSKAKASTAEFMSAKKRIDHANQALDGVIEAVSADISKRADEDVARIRQEEDMLKKNVSKIGIERLRLLETSQDTYCESLKWAEHTLEKANSVLEQSSRFEVLELKGKLVKNLTDVSEQQVPGPVESLSPFIAFSPGPVKTNQPLGKILLEEKWEMKTQFHGEVSEGFKLAAEGFKMAASIAAFTTNDLIVADLEKHKIIVFTPKGGLKYIFDSPVSQPDGELYRPYDLSVTKDDRVMVIDQPRNEASSATVKVFQAHNAHKIKHLLNITSLHVSKAHEDYDISCIGADENYIAVGNTAEKEIFLYKTDGSLVSTIPAPMLDRRLAISNQGRLIFSNYANYKLISLDMEGKEIFCTDTVVNGVKLNPAGMCCDRFGDIYIVLHAGELGGEIHHYSAEGAHIRRIAQHLHNPLGLTIMPNGDLAVADMLSVKVYHKV